MSGLFLRFSLSFFFVLWMESGFFLFYDMYNSLIAILAAYFDIVTVSSFPSRQLVSEFCWACANALLARLSSHLINSKFYIQMAGLGSTVHFYSFSRSGIVILWGDSGFIRYVPFFICKNDILVKDFIVPFLFFFPKTETPSTRARSWRISPRSWSCRTSWASPRTTTTVRAAITAARAATADCWPRPTGAPSTPEPATPGSPGRYNNSWMSKINKTTMNKKSNKKSNTSQGMTALSLFWFFS